MLTTTPTGGCKGWHCRVESSTGYIAIQGDIRGVHFVLLLLVWRYPSKEEQGDKDNSEHRRQLSFVSTSRVLLCSRRLLIVSRYLGFIARVAMLAEAHRIFGTTSNVPCRLRNILGNIRVYRAYSSSLVHDYICRKIIFSL